MACRDAHLFFLGRSVVPSRCSAFEDSGGLREGRRVHVGREVLREVEEGAGNDGEKKNQGSGS